MTYVHSSLLSIGLILSFGFSATPNSSSGSQCSQHTPVGVEVPTKSASSVDLQDDWIVAIDDETAPGPSYIVMEDKSGSRCYTRNAHLIRGPQGELSTKDGKYKIPGVTLPLNIKQLNIREDGLISLFTGGELEPRLGGQIMVATFKTSAKLRKTSDSVYYETSETEPPEISRGALNGRALIKRFVPTGR